MDSRIDCNGTIRYLATGAVVTGEVAALDHEVLDHAVEGRALKVQRLLRVLADALLASAKSAEVIGSAGDYIIAEFNDDAASGTAPDGDVEEDARLSSHGWQSKHRICLTRPTHV